MKEKTTYEEYSPKEKFVIKMPELLYFIVIYDIALKFKTKLF